jgi:hypothetical protein
MSLDQIFGEGEEETANFLRQMDVITPTETRAVTIIGTGAIGSAIGIFSGKMGVQNMTLIDGDMVERHNIPNQYFGYEHVGRSKAEALYEEIRRYTPDNMKPLLTYYDEMFTEESDIHTPIVMMCVDGLDTRRMVINRLREISSVEWVIDVRMAAQYYEIITIDMNNEEEIDKFIESTFEEAMEAPCTNRAVIFTVAIAGGYATAFMKDLMKGNYDNVPKIMYESLDHIRTFPRVIGWR